MLTEIVTGLKRRFGGDNQPQQPVVVQPPLCLLEGHDHDSVTNLSFSARALTIPAEATRISFAGEQELTLVGRWVERSIVPVPHIESAIGPQADLGHCFSIHLNTVHTIIHPDGRIFHKAELWGDGEQSRDPQRLDDAISRLEAIFGPGNPTNFTNFEGFLQSI